MSPVVYESRLAAQLSPEPRFRKTQIVTHHVDGPAERLGRLLRGHPAKVLHFNDARQRFVVMTEHLERPVQVEQLRFPGAAFTLHLQACGFQSFLPAARSIAAFPCGSRSRVVHQNLPHYAGRDSQEMYSARKLLRPVSTELQVRLMNERSRLECVVRPFLAELPGGNTA
jgi:hypothetical protein